MTLSISDSHRNARSAATIAFADSGSGNSYIRIMDANDALLVTIGLTKPCGTMDSGLIRLTQEASMGDQITADGVAAKAVWMNRNGEVVATGVVTNSAGSGDFKISSAAGTSLYAGGYVILGVTSLS